MSTPPKEIFLNILEALFVAEIFVLDLTNGEIQLKLGTPRGIHV
jgi:hypothetical protein